MPSLGSLWAVAQRNGSGCGQLGRKYLLSRPPAESRPERAARRPAKAPTRRQSSLPYFIFRFVCGPLNDPLEIALTAPKQSLFRSNRFLILASSKFDASWHQA